MKAAEIYIAQITSLTRATFKQAFEWSAKRLNGDCRD
jgi:hypothetical protein